MICSVLLVALCVEVRQVVSDTSVDYVQSVSDTKNISETSILKTVTTVIVVCVSGELERVSNDYLQWSGLRSVYVSN